MSQALSHRFQPRFQLTVRSSSEYMLLLVCCHNKENRFPHKLINTSIWPVPLARLPDPLCSVRLTRATTNIYLNDVDYNVEITRSSLT